MADIIYIHSTGALYYDASGDSHGDVQQIVILDTAFHPKTIATTDFIIGVSFDSSNVWRLVNQK